MPYYILHSDKGAPHYVCVYGLSDYSCRCMPYYTCHKHKGAHHYVCDVLYQTTLLTVCLIIHITNIMALTTVFAIMPYQTTVVTECLITHITNIRALTTVFAFMVYQTNLVTVCPIRHDIHKGAQHYAIVDV